ncbi:MAG TPA: FliM/FliN family flagellar motor C-terminal domain-containing protein [Candidatus Baltobacteraceae bacterium]|nr:FliM/FliN family flagellar motor C-terminal domain-containing protein [Candidatus Baltobacteraceae bacterium]
MSGSSQKRVRAIRFQQRSSLPVSAACIVANGVRETLGALLASPVSLRLLEPRIPDPQAWNTLCSGAQLYAVRGPVCDAAFVIRPGDALALASSAFGELPDAQRPLSALEREVLVRALRGIAGSLAPVCGRELSPLEPILDIHGYVTYFELLVERPVAARLGIALSRDPVARSGASALHLEDLGGVEIEVCAQFACGMLTAEAFLGLRPGTIVPMKTRVGEPGLLKIGGAVIARGECGALGERSAFIVTAPR